MAASGTNQEQGPVAVSEQISRGGHPFESRNARQQGVGGDHFQRGVRVGQRRVGQAGFQDLAPGVFASGKVLEQQPFAPDRQGDQIRFEHIRLRKDATGQR